MTPKASTYEPRFYGDVSLPLALRLMERQRANDNGEPKGTA